MNASCLFANPQSSGFLYQGQNQSSRSSLLILAGSLRANLTYQWMVIMSDRSNNSTSTNGSLFIEIKSSETPEIFIEFDFLEFRFSFTFDCFSSSSHIRRFEYLYVNPTSQITLHSRCNGDCRNESFIEWNIYGGSTFSPNNTLIWTKINQTDSLIFGEFYLDETEGSKLKEVFMWIFLSRRKTEKFNHNSKIFQFLFDVEFLEI